MVGNDNLTAALDYRRSKMIKFTKKGIQCSMAAGLSVYMKIRAMLKSDYAKFSKIYFHNFHISHLDNTD